MFIVLIISDYNFSICDYKNNRFDLYDSIFYLCIREIKKNITIKNQ